MANTLSYYNMKLFTAVKGFIVLAPGKARSIMVKPYFHRRKNLNKLECSSITIFLVETYFFKSQEVFHSQISDKAKRQKSIWNLEMKIVKF